MASLLEAGHVPVSLFCPLVLIPHLPPGISTYFWALISWMEGQWLF